MLSWIVYVKPSGLSHHLFVRVNISTHGSLRRGGQRLGMVRYDYRLFGTGADVPSMVQMWSTGPL